MGDEDWPGLTSLQNKELTKRMQDALIHYLEEIDKMPEFFNAEDEEEYTL